MKRMLASDGVNYYSSQPFLNRMRGAGALTSQNAPAKPGENVAYFLVPLHGDEGRRMVATWDGDADINFGGGDQIATRNRIEFTAPGGHQMMVIARGTPASIRVMPIDQETLTQTFKPEFVADVALFYAWRAMDGLNTNASLADHLPIYPTPERYGQDMTLSEVVELTNMAGVRLWANLAHLVTADAMKEAIDYLDKHCAKPPLLEFSNEIVWNWQFVQTHYANEQRPGDPGGWLGEQVAKMLTMAEGTQVGIVLASQFVNAWQADQALRGIREAGQDPRKLEVLAVTSYVSHDLNDFATNPDLAWNFCQADDVQGALDYIKSGIPKFVEQLTEYTRRAADLDVEIWAYEGGMFHLNSATCQTHDARVLQKFFEKMQMSDGAAAVLEAYDDAFAKAGGTVQALYNYASPPSEFGFFAATLQPVWDRIRAELGATGPVVAPEPTPAPAPAPMPAPVPAPAPPVPQPAPAPAPAVAKVTKEQIYVAIREQRASLSNLEALVKAYRASAG